MFKVPHRHLVLSVPDMLWDYLDNWNNRKLYMDAAINALNDYFSKTLKKIVTVGVIVILHPYGKDMKKQPHLHLLITEGAFDCNGKFYPKKYIKADGFRKTWQHHILKILQQHGLSNSFASLMYRKYPKGFYVWVHKRGRITNPKIISKYVGRYVRHPAIANSRITKYDGKHVWFYYIDNNDKYIEVKMTVNEFILALIQHIPPPQFKMIRYYGAYARRSKKKYGLQVLQSGIRQKTLREFGFKELELCPNCGSILKFICYNKKGPPKRLQNQKTLKKYLV
jgi:hypothetical protein